MSDVIPFNNHETVAAQESLIEDARRYRFLRDSSYCALKLSRNVHPALNYVTVTDWIDKYDQEEFVDVDATEIEAMKKTNTLWELQIHPTTPVGYNVAYGSTLDHVIDAAIRDLEDIDVVGCQHVAT